MTCDLDKKWEWITDLKGVSSDGLHFEIYETGEGHEYLLFKNQMLVSVCYSYNELLQEAENFR